ncbi:MAG: HAD family hydrolase [Candidatus Thorarchaeota archaeon]
MEPHDIRAIVFDLGDTLYNTHWDPVSTHKGFLGQLGIINPAEVSDAALAEILKPSDEWLDGYAVKNNVGQHWDPPREIWMEYGRHTLQTIGFTGDVEKVVDEYQTKWEEFLAEYPTPLNDHCKETLTELDKRGYIMGIASNRYADPIPRLERDGLVQFFKSIEYTATPGYAKPNPYMLVKVAAELGMNPMRCAYVGNKVGDDVGAARRCGMLPILIVGCNPDEAQKADGDTIIITNLDELLKHFKGPPS